MAERGEKLDEALALLNEAVRLRPRSGHIIDSLGWALFQLGRYAEAVDRLETALALAPGVAEIADHLGDAYWRTGREDDARLEWRRASTLDPSPELRARIDAKLRDGLAPAAPRS